MYIFYKVNCILSFICSPFENIKLC